MGDIISNYWKSLVSRREFGKVTIGSAGAFALPLPLALAGQTAQPAGLAPGKMVKNINVLYRRPELSHEEFVKHWAEIHAPMANNIPQVRRYVLCPVIPQPTRPNNANEPGPDGVAETWFDNWDESQSFSSLPEAKKWFADGRTFIGHSISVMAERS